MFVEDTAPFFSDFAVDATLDGVPVRGIFDADHVVAEIGSSGMAACAPAFILPSTDVPAAFSGLQIVLSSNATVWRIAEHHPDGTGLSTLLLERAA